MKKSYLFQMTIISVLLVSFLTIIGCSSGGGTAAAAAGAAGSLDTAGFSAPNGFVTMDVDFSTHTGEAYAVALQSNGKSVVAGYAYNAGHYQFAVARFNTNGTLDTTFNAAGAVPGVAVLQIDNASWAKAVAIQTDQKIVVAGYCADVSSNNRFAIARYNTDGTLDISFGGNGGDDAGTVTTVIAEGNGTDDRINGVAIQPIGGIDYIVVAGHSYNGANDIILVARYDTDGVLDASFGNYGDGTYYWNNSMPCRAHALAVQSNGMIVVAGWSFVSSTGMNVFRLYDDGSDIDVAFNGGSVATAQIDSNETKAYSVAVQGDGSIVAAGYTYDTTNHFAVARFTAAGVLDTTFNSTGSTPGTVTTPVGDTPEQANAVQIQTGDQKIVVAGYTYNGTKANFALIRYNTNGTLDTSFGTGGKVTTDVVSGQHSMAEGLAIQSDGKIVAAGHAIMPSGNVFAIVRYWP